MRWTVEMANAWHEKTGFLAGCNYVPSTAVNATEMWQAETFDLETIRRELGLAAGAGYNSVRVFLQFIVWAEEPEAFMRRLAAFMDAARENNILVMPVFFDDCFTREPYLGKQDEPIPGKTNSQWTQSPGSSIADDPLREAALREFVTSIVAAYGNDPGVVVWDLYNEPGASGRREKCLPLVEKAFEWARSAKPMQPLTVGYWEDEEYNLRFEELSDVISFHDYLSPEGSAERIARLKRHGRPLLCTEWLNRGGGNTFETHLTLYHREGIGAYNWGLVAGRLQTYLGWEMSKNPKSGYPLVWMHDIFYPNGTPYDEKEVKLLRRLRNEP